MDDAGALLGGDVVGGHHPPPVGVGGRGQVVEGPPVAEPGQAGPRDAVRDRGLRTEDLGDQRLGHQHPVHHRVGERRVDGGAGVGEQGPRGGGPHHQRGGAPHPCRVGVDQGEADVGRLVLLLVVHAGLAELVARQRGPAARAVGDDLHPLVEEALVEELLEVPPHRLDVLGAHGPVRGVEVDPVADAPGQLGEVVDVGEDRGAAEPGELGHADLVFDLLLPGDPQLLLDLHLHRQPVGVPTGPSGDPEAPHGAEPAEEVLVDPGPHVVQAGPAVGRGRTLVEDPRFGAGPLADRALEHLVLLPARQFEGLHRDEVSVGGNGLEHSGPRGSWADGVAVAVARRRSGRCDRGRPSNGDRVRRRPPRRRAEWKS